jgi:methionine biosynthesis protein MetW
MNGKEQVALAERSDFQAIAAWVKPECSVLDLGCGDGVLLKYLRQTRNARGYGIDIDDANVLACVKNGVNVIQSDLERGLAGFDAGSFDCVILSQTLQAVRRTEEIVLDMLRVGREAIVSSPTSAAGTCGCSSRWAARCRCRRSCPTSGTTRRTCTFSPSPTSSRFARATASACSSASSCTRGGR